MTAPSAPVVEDGGTKKRKREDILGKENSSVKPPTIGKANLNKMDLQCKILSHIFFLIVSNIAQMRSSGALHRYQNW